MAEIQVLPKQVADMIAAGEVVERPASAAKELIENSIDAGAKEITVEIRRGGVSYLRVTDDGKGIPAQEVATAFLRHATSKIRTEEDLEAIGTLGFRGEALAAISAVAHVEMLTKTRDTPVGHTITIEGGETLHEGEAGCPDGTTVVVRSLFFNIPARYKFLKKDAAEGAAVHAVFQREALAHPEIAFRFIRDGVQELSTAGDDDMGNAIYAVLGRGLAGDMIPIRGQSEGAAVTGFITRPTACRGSRSYQYFFLNGRWIRSKLVMAALENAYRNQKMVGKFPGGVLYLATRLSAVDVNSHPTKTEVKFVRDKDIYDAVYYAAISALGGEDDRPVLHLDPRGFALEEGGVPSRAWDENRLEFHSPAPAVPSRTAAVKWETLREELYAADEEEPSGAQEGHPAPTPAADMETETEAEDAGPGPVFRVREVVAPPEAAQPPLWPTEPAPVAGQTRLMPDLPAGGPPAAGFREAEDGPGEEIPVRPEGQSWRLVGEVLHTYIVVEQGETVLFIDKHAAHERMNFDRLKAQGCRAMSQELLAPVVFRPSPEEGAVLLENRAKLEELGFEVADFGSGNLMTARIPHFLTPEETPQALSELAQKLLSAAGLDPDAQRDELLHTMACKAAIKGGQKNDPQELLRVAQAVMSGQVRHCPHGRPVATQLTRTQLERQFRRS